MRSATTDSPLDLIDTTEALTSLMTEFSRAIRNGISRPPRTYRQWLESCVVIPDGKHKGKRFRVDRQPVVGLWIDAIDSGQFNEYIFTAPSQFGKTLIAFVGPLLYHTCELAENYVLGVPFADMAADKWDLDVRPVMLASPYLRGLLPAYGSGSAGGKIRERVTLRSGVEIKLMSAGSDDSAKAGFTSRVLGVTEAARFSAAGGSSVEADPLRQLRARQRSFEEHERVTYIEGTVTIEEELPWALKPISTDSRILTPCPHCEAWVAPERDDLVGWNDAKSENEAADKAFWACPSCGQQITEDERKDCVRAAVLVHRGQTVDKRGQVIGPPPDTSRLFFRAAAFHNFFLSAASIAKDEWKALQISEDSPERFSADKELCQFVHCIPYVDPLMSEDLELDRVMIARRRLDLPAQVLPQDTRWLTAACDVGEKHLWYMLLCTRIDAEGNIYRHVPVYGNIDVPSQRMPLRDALFAALDQFGSLLDAGFLLEGSGGALRLPDQEWIDCNFETDTVLAWVRRRNALKGWPADKRKYQPCVGAYGRGSSQMQKSTARYNTPRKTNNTVRDIDPSGMWYLEHISRAKTMAVFWDSDTTKWQVQQSLTLPLWQLSDADPAAAPKPRDMPADKAAARQAITGLQPGAAVEQAGRHQVSGSVTFYAGTSKTHERLARHLTNEQKETTVAATGTRRKWVRRGANHLLDTFAMCWRATERAKHIATKLTYLPPFVEQGQRQAATPTRTLPAPTIDSAKSSGGGGWYARE